MKDQEGDGSMQNDYHVSISDPILSGTDCAAARLRPESLGIPSGELLALFQGIDEHALQTHGVIVLRHGRIAAEGYWAPYARDEKHRMYSVSKSFTATAVGLLVDRGMLRLSERVADIFPEYVPSDPHPYLLETTVRDLLLMAAPSSPAGYTEDGPDWVRAFLAHRSDHPAGTQFAYDTGATVTLGAIVQKRTGKPFFAYLWENLLEAIGFDRDSFCVEQPDGRQWGGSGVCCSLRELARFAQLYLNKGVWEGKRLLSEEWVREATALQITNDTAFVPGYGYQIWRHRDGFWFNGMGSQYAFVFPEKELVIATVGETMLAGDEAKWYWLPAVKRLADSLSDAPLPDDPETAQALRAKLESLRLACARGAADSPRRARVDGVTWKLGENPMGIAWVKLSFFGEEGALDFENGAGVHQIRFGFGRQVQGEFPEKVYGRRIWTYRAEGYRCFTSAAWADPDTLCLRSQLIDINCGTVWMAFAFKDMDGKPQVSLRMRKAGEWMLDRYEGFAGGQPA